MCEITLVDCRFRTIKPELSKMTTPLDEEPALYPPTVTGPEKPLGLLRFLKTFVANPIRTIPQAAYTEPFVVLQRGSRTIVWISDPALIERVILKEADAYPRS